MKPRYSSEALQEITRNTRETTLRLWDVFGPSHFHLGRVWYPDASTFAQRVARTYSVNVKQVIAAIAVLSPQIAWMDNVLDVIKVLELHDDDYMALGANINKAHRLLIEGEDPWDVMGGKKVTRFYLNISAPYDDGVVTLDSHMARIYGLEPSHLFELQGVYEAVEEGVKKAAHEIEVIPSQIQATLWIAGRGRKAHPTFMKGSK